MKSKTVSFAYPTSTLAAFFGFPAAGCWVLETVEDSNPPFALSGYASREEAMRAAATVDLPWWRIFQHHNPGVEDSAENGPQLCDCGAVASWHGERDGLREFCCDGCWAVSGGNPERVAVAVPAGWAVLAVVLDAKRAPLSAEVISDPARLDALRGWCQSPCSVLVVPLQLCIAARSLSNALRGVLDEFDKYDNAMAALGRGHEDYGFHRSAGRAALALAERGDA